MTPTQLMFDPDSEFASCEEAPIACRVKESARTRRVYLRVVPGHGLVVTVPRRFPRRDLAALIESKRVWIEKALAELDAKTPAAYRQWPPSCLALTMLGRAVDIHYCKPGIAGQADWHWDGIDSLTCRVDVFQREALARCVAAALKQLTS